MVDSSRKMEYSPRPGGAPRLINEIVIPSLIGWATAVENGAYRAGEAVRKNPGRFAIWALVLGYAVALAGARVGGRRRGVPR